MTLLIGSLTIGLILSLLAFGVLISFKIFDFADITADGSITLGASVAAVMLVKGYSPLCATLSGFGSGFIAGFVTGLLHTKFNIHSLLSGILVMTALYSINLHIMGKSNVPLLNEKSVSTLAEEYGKKVFSAEYDVNVFGWEIPAGDLMMLCIISLIIFISCILLYLFFRTNLGTAMRATGNNPQMIRALGVNTGNMTMLGIALSNGLIALSGALLAQYQGFADVQMGIGIIVWGLASVIIGEALVGKQSLALLLIGAIIGSVIFRLIVAIALRWGMNPNDLKLVTAIFVFIALIIPDFIKKLIPVKQQQNTGGS
ncbi:ABC transporter permease [Candidatus Dependentiae bacterium]|nr:ABC transporter permease [Candidatus Dependentiae bacterium]